MWADSVFSPSNQGRMDEPKFDRHRFGKNWELENGKKIGVLAIQKVAKTGNIGKKTSVADNIDYARYTSMQN